MSSAYRILPYYTYADYLHWEGNWELIEGIPYAMSPAPGMRHQHIAGNLFAILRQSLAGSLCNCSAFLPVDYKVAEDTVVQPDVLVICNPQLAGKVLEQTPALVAEVLSPSTALKDRNSKYHLYEKAGVPYYLIIDQEQSIVEVYRLTNGAYQLEPVNPKQVYTFYFPDCSASVLLHAIWE